MHVGEAGPLQATPQLAPGKWSMVDVALSIAPANVPVRPSSRREADAPDAYVRFARKREPVHGADPQHTSGLQHSSRLHDDGFGITTVLQCTEREHATERRGGEWQVLRVGAHEGSIDSGFRQAPPRNDQPIAPVKCRVSAMYGMYENDACAPVAIIGRPAGL